VRWTVGAVCGLAAAGPLALGPLVIAFDVDKAVLYGSGRKPIPMVEDSVECATLTLTSPALRVATLVREASASGREPDRAEIEAAARPLLVATYAYRKPESLLGTQFNRARWSCTSSRPPQRMVLAAKAHDRVLNPVQKLENDEQSWGTVDGAKWTSHAARASFGFDEALKLAGAAGELRVVVGFADDEAGFKFGSKDLKNLEPDWAR
jgi:hypothetical protein